MERDDAVGEVDRGEKRGRGEPEERGLESPLMDGFCVDPEGCHD